MDAGDWFSSDSLRECKSPRDVTLYLGPGLTLYPHMPADGFTPGNGFNEAFVTNDLDEWHGPFADRTWRITGNVTVEFWTRGIGTAAPVVIGGEAGEGYHFFNQFGTNRGFVESYAVEYASALPDEQVRHYTETFAMPAGGILLEPGDYVRLLLTNLVQNDLETDEGPHILWGASTPSRITYRAACEETPQWATRDAQRTDVVVPAHQGLLTGAVPATEPLNVVDVPFDLHPETDRLTIQLVADMDRTPKNDMDLEVIGPTGVVWGIGSPYTDEIGTRWTANLEELMASGSYIVRVNSYSGHAYVGTVFVTQEVRA